MDCALKVISSSSSSSLCISPTNNSHSNKSSSVVFKPHFGNHSNDVVSRPCSPRTVSCAKRDLHRERSGLESLFCYDKAIPEEIIEKPVGLSLSEKNTGENPRCTGCQAKGAVLCTTCSGSGLYVDSILESQGIIVKVRCLGCGGTGNIMCSECGGRGHVGLA